MISYALVVLGVLGATLIPAYISLYLITNLKFIHIRYVAAAGVGLTFWYFFDTMGDAAQLDVNNSISNFGGFPHAAVIVTFLAGIAALAIFDHFAVPASRYQTLVTVQQQTANGGTVSYAKALFLIPVGVAAITGIHSLGEGWVTGATASQAPTQSLADAFGGLYSLISYPLHKFFEAAIIAAVYSAYVARSSASSKAIWQLPVLGLLFGLPSVIGSSIGYSVAFDATYFYAFGVTGALYAALRLIEPISSKFKVGENAPAYLGGRVFLAIAIGFFLLYTAALFH